MRDQRYEIAADRGDPPDLRSDVGGASQCNDRGQLPSCGEAEVIHRPPPSREPEQCGLSWRGRQSRTDRGHGSWSRTPTVTPSRRTSPATPRTVSTVDTTTPHG